jgi:hypothetical protein
MMTMKHLSHLVFMLTNRATGYIQPFTRQCHVYKLIEAVASSALFLPNHDDAPIIQAPHGCRNYQI